MKITLFRGFALIAAFLCFSLTKAQTVSGTVSDPVGPLPGASVVVKGTTNGTQTDFDGNYTLNDVAADAVLVISYIGFATQEIPVNGQTTINVTLQEDASELDEVVVVGYGTQSKRTAVGSVESVKAEEFNKGVIVNPQQLIQGKTAGVQISASNGEPGAAVNVRIRGTASVRSNNNPLYVVDGVPLSGGNTSAQGGGGNTDLGTTTAVDPLSFLNPNDIASIDILLDASATAIYGSRGANGVVLITTKQGTTGKGTLEFSSNFSIGFVPNQIDILDRNSFLDTQNRLARIVSPDDPNASFADSGFNTDTFDTVFKTSLTSNYNLSYGAGNENGSYRISLGYLDQEGEVEDSFFDRLTIRFNGTQRFFDNKLKLDVQATISNIENQRSPITDTANARGDLLSSAYNFDPTQSFFDENGPGGFNQPSAERRNPLALLELTRTASSTLRALINTGIQYNFSDNFSFRTNIGLDKATSSAYQVQSPFFQSNQTINVGRTINDEIDNTNTTWESYFNYNKAFGDDRLDLTLGHSFQEFINETIVLQAAGFDNPDLFLMVNNLASAEVQIADSSQAVDELQSFFFRANYSINGKYNFSGTVRRDGSSRFGDNNRYGTFGAIGASWILSEEDWFLDVFDTFRLKANWGVVGNQEGLGNNQFSGRQRRELSTIENNLNVTRGGTPDVAFANPNLRWEENTQFSIGVDFGLLDNKITGSLGYYNYITEGFLLERTAPQPSPQDFFFTNVDGEIKNSGVDFSINVYPIETEDFTWDFNVNFNYNDNILEGFDGQVNAAPINGPGLTGAFAQRLASGQPLFSYFIRDWVGLTDAPNPDRFGLTDGINIFRDADGNTGTADPGAVFVGESALPDITLGITQNFTYKNWDLSLFFNGLFGQSIYNNTANAYLSIANLTQGRNSSVEAASLVGTENPFNIQEVSSRFLEDGSFLRLQNVNLGYTVPLSETSIFSGLRLNLTAQNLFVITGYSGQDPEVSTPQLLNNIPSAGIDFTAYPRPTIISLGFNASF